MEQWHSKGGMQVEANASGRRTWGADTFCSNLKKRFTAEI